MLIKQKGRRIKKGKLAVPRQNAITSKPQNLITPLLEVECARCYHLRYRIGRRAYLVWLHEIGIALTTPREANLRSSAPLFCENLREIAEPLHPQNEDFIDRIPVINKCYHYWAFA